MRRKKMKKLVIFLFIFFIISVLLFVGCFEEEKSTENGKETLEGLGYINEVFMYGFNPPEGFSLTEESSLKNYVSFVYTPYVNESSQLGLYIYASNISANISLPNRSIEEIAQGLQDSLSNITIYKIYLISYNVKTVNGMDFYEIVFNTPTAPSENKSVYWKYIYVVKDDRMLSVQVISSSELYNNHIDDIDRSLNSLILLKLNEMDWDLEKYYNGDDTSNDRILMTAREHAEDRAVVIYFSNIKIFYYSLNTGDTIIIQDTISNISYNINSDTTTVSFNWDVNGSIETLYFLFEGNIINQYHEGDKVNITITIQRVTFSNNGINYDLELYAECWENEEYFKEHLRSPLNIAQGLKPLPSNLIEKLSRIY